jgi:hypothetical protein
MPPEVADALKRTGMWRPNEALAGEPESEPESEVTP